MSDVRDEHDAYERRGLVDRRREAVMSALDGILAELEELSLADVVTAPASCRARVAELAAEVFDFAEPSNVPSSVTDLIDVVFATRDAALVNHRGAMRGLVDR